jgi:hypothetical protein
LLAQLYVGKRPISEGIGRVIRRFGFLARSPGVDTGFVPGRRSGCTGEICGDHTAEAETVLAYAVRLRYFTGSVIQVDGGRHL